MHFTVTAGKCSVLSCYGNIRIIGFDIGPSNRIVSIASVWIFRYMSIPDFCGGMWLEREEIIYLLFTE